MDPGRPQGEITQVSGVSKALQISPKRAYFRLFSLSGGEPTHAFLSNCHPPKPGRQPWWTLVPLGVPLAAVRLKERDRQRRPRPAPDHGPRAAGALQLQPPRRHHLRAARVQRPRPDPSDGRDSPVPHGRGTEGQSKADHSNTFFQDKQKLRSEQGGCLLDAGGSAKNFGLHSAMPTPPPPAP